MLANITDLFLNEIQKEENKQKLNAFLYEYTSDFKFYIYLAMFLLVLSVVLGVVNVYLGFRGPLEVH